MTALDVSDAVVIVTGGGRGVGRGVSVRFLEAGAQVVICGRKEPDELPAVGTPVNGAASVDVGNGTHLELQQVSGALTR